MYAEFDTVPFTAMSKIGSEPLLCDSLSRPPMSESPACGRGPPAPEGKGDTQREAEDDGGGGAGGGGGQASRAAVAEEDGTQDEVSSNQAAEEGRRGEQGDDIRHGHHHDDDDGDVDDDEGYHTPTSPRHRIPADLPCPPAPRKALPEPRWRKRKAADRAFYRVVWRRSQLPALGFELVICPVPLGSRTTESRASLADMLVKNKKNL